MLLNRELAKTVLLQDALVWCGVVLDDFVVSRTGKGDFDGWLGCSFKCCATGVDVVLVGVGR